jgi:tetratricopeptide (TPR) repeat protein
MAAPGFIAALLLTAGVALATQLSVWREQSNHDSTRSGSVLEMLMGDSRRLFANHFVTKADVYLHRGVYPSIFDQAQRERESHLAQGPASTGDETGHSPNDGHADHDDHDADEPRDWIDAFGRNFYPVQHGHLEGKTEQREILPWLRLAAELNPNQPDIYPLAAYWLRQRMGKVKEAEAFLREGWRANPDSYEILFELGRLNEENHQDPVRARNLFEAALRKWEQTERAKDKPDEFGYMQITGHLARLEERAGHIDKAIAYLEQLRTVSPNPDSIQSQIERLSTAPAATP